MAMADRAIQTVIITAVFTALCTVFVAARLYTRFYIIRGPGYEDWILVASWVRLEPNVDFRYPL
jgi:hypothetical protein